MPPSRCQDGIMISLAQTGNFIMMEELRVWVQVQLIWFDSIQFFILYLFYTFVITSCMWYIYLCLLPPTLLPCHTLPDYDYLRTQTLCYLILYPNVKHGNLEERSSKNFQRQWDFSWVTKDERKLHWWQKAFLAKGLDWTKMISSGSHT